MSRADQAVGMFKFLGLPVFVEDSPLTRVHGFYVIEGEGYVIAPPRNDGEVPGCPNEYSEARCCGGGPDGCIL